MVKVFHISSKLTLIFVMVVILAGSVVRMTGSGMGCPDWPKCFGNLIPPTNIDQVIWKAKKKYNKGQFVLKDEILWEAKADFKSEGAFVEQNWEEFEEHSYAKFNPVHTWIEYINRLTSVFLGIFALTMLVSGFKLFFKTRKSVFFVSLLIMFFIGFEAWLGKVVVASELQPVKISIHMLGALLILVLCVYQRTLFLKPVKFISDPRKSKGIGWVVLLVLVLSGLQILFGIEVRENIDNLSKEMVRSSWMGNIDLIFYFHRSLSILFFIVNAWLVRKIYSLTENKGLRFYGVLLIGLMLVEIITGIGLTYFNMPPALQPTHLLIASGMLAIQVYLVINLYKKDERDLIVE